MKKKFLVPALALTIIGGGVGGSVITTSVFASTPDNSSKTEVSDVQEQKQLEKEATITKKDATSTALKEVKGEVAETELENEDGTVVYGVEITDNKGKEYDVKIDAKTGEVLKVEAGDENEKGDKEEGEDNDAEVSDEKEQQQLEKEATVTKEEATATALQKVKGQVKETDLDDEDGAVVYGVKITDDQGKKHDVKIDAKTGKVLKVEADDENENESENESDQE